MRNIGNRQKAIFVAGGLITLCLGNSAVGEHCVGLHLASAGATLTQGDSFFGNLLKVYMPRRMCMYEETSLIQLHIVCDTVISLAYFSIPLALIKLVRGRRDLRFNWMFGSFAVFILACGLTHVLSVIAIWSPVYRLDGLIKLITAIASVTTAIVLWPLIPKVIAIPHTDALRASELKFRRLLETAPDAMVIVDALGMIEIVNAQAEAMFGYPAAEMVGQPIELLIPSRLQAVHVAKRDDYLAAPTVRGMGVGKELFGVRKDQTEFPVEISLSPMHIAGAVKVSSAIRDISARKSAESEIAGLNKALRLQNLELVTANNELEAFSYSVSHDLRAPLRSIDGFSKAILEDCIDTLDSTGQDYLKRVRGASQRMGRLIDDMLNLSRVSRGDLLNEPTDLSQIAREVIDEYRAGSKDREVHIEIADGLVADADPRLMRVVLSNLLGNAWKFTSRTAAASIVFGSNSDGGQKEYFVRDNGAGFDMAYVDKLFGAFQRLHSENDYPGTGIGLATIQRVIHRHGGQVRAQSKVGEGATFYFTLRQKSGVPNQVLQAAT